MILSRLRHSAATGVLAIVLAACGSPAATTPTAPPAASTPTPGMMMPSSAMSMGGHDMTPVDASGAAPASPDARGGQPLPFTRDGDVKVFEITPQVARWYILPGVEIGAYTYNGTLPGPTIHVTAGDRARFVVTNQLPEPTTIHWHGLQVPNDQDGPAEVTQPPIQPGEAYTYEYTVPDTPGTYFYHTHYAVDRQQALGLYGAYLIEPKTPETGYAVDYTVMLGEWTILGGQTYPAMDMSGMQPNYFTINGKSYPATETIHVKVGDRVRLRLIGSGQFIHPMHLHGQPFTIVATDGNPVPEGAQWVKDTVLVGPGERYDVEFVARAPGKWLFHCHINHHTTNNGAEDEGAGGLTMIVNVTP